MGDAGQSVKFLMGDAGQSVKFLRTRTRRSGGGPWPFPRRTADRNDLFPGAWQPRAGVTS